MDSRVRPFFRVLAAAFFLFAGFLHFVRPAPYLRIMPPYLPWHPGLVYVSGAAEMAGGAGLLIRALRRAAGWGLVALLIAVFPANIYMAVNHVQMTVRPMPTGSHGRGCRCRRFLSGGCCGAAMLKPFDEAGIRAIAAG